MRREEFPVGRPDWENVIIEEGLTYSVDGPHDTDHYWNEYAAYIFSPQEMDSVRAQAEEMHRMCLETVEYIASGAFGTLGLPQAAFNLAVESWNRRDADFYGRFDFTYSGGARRPDEAARIQCRHPYRHRGGGSQPENLGERPAPRHPRLRPLG